MADSLTNTPEYTVSEISQAVKRTVEDTFDHVRIRGEVGRLSRPGSGHLYFDLKDDKSVISAVAWKGTAQRWRFQPEQGLEVIATGRLTTFPGQSRYQIIVESIEPAGAGALMALLEERRKKLAAEGLFDAERKKDLPYLPRVIGVVTSPTGAVIRDILHRLDERFPCHVIVWPCRVQGETSAAEVAAAVRGFNAFEKNGPIARPDLIIVARGGGSVEDLWGYNEEVVVRAVAESDIPVISAVGHETDTTLVDYAADKRAPTPTGAAEIAVPVRSELIAYVDDQGMRQRMAVRRSISNWRDRVRAAGGGLPRPVELLNTARQRLDHASERLAGGLRSAGQKKAIVLARLESRLSVNLLKHRVDEGQRRTGELGARLPILAKRQITDRRRNLPALSAFTGSLRSNLNQAGQRLNTLSERPDQAMARGLAERYRKLESLDKLLNSLSHKSVIARGFALVTDENGELVRNAAQLSGGQKVALEFTDGKLGATIDGEPPQQRPKQAPRPGKKLDGQTSLF